MCEYLRKIVVYSMIFYDRIKKQKLMFSSKLSYVQLKKKKKRKKESNKESEFVGKNWMEIISDTREDKKKYFLKAVTSRQ